MSISTDLIQTRSGLRNDYDTDELEVPSNSDSPLQFVHPLIFLHDRWRIASDLGVPVIPGLKSTNRSTLLGQGLSFTVKNGVHTILEYGSNPIRVAMKIPKLSQTRTSKTKIEMERAKNVLNEIHILTHQPLRTHRNIVRLLSLGWTETSNDSEDIMLMLVMEFSKEGTLAEFQSKKERLPFVPKMYLCKDIALGLQALHDCGIVHGDVKAENVLIFIDKQGTPVAKVSDFGTALITGCKFGVETDDEPECRLSVGTQLWMAPETSEPIKRSKLHLTDIYSFGLLAWKTLIDGANPFDDFDLPKDLTARMAKIEAIKKDFTNGHASVAIAKILKAQDVEVAPIDEFALMWLFMCTIYCEPERRSLSAALNHGTHKDSEEQIMLLPMQFDILKTSQEPDCVNNRNLVPELQKQLVAAYQETLDNAQAILSQERGNFQARSFVVQCSWILSIFRFGLNGIWTGPLAEDLTPLIWNVYQLGSGTEKRTAMSMLFSLAETCSTMPTSPKLPELIESGIEAAKQGVFSAILFLRRYAQSTQKGLQYFSPLRDHPSLSTSEIETINHLNEFVDALVGNKWHLPSHQQLVDVNDPTYQVSSFDATADSTKTITDEEPYVLTACRKGDTNHVMQLLRKGHDAQARNSIGESCLHWLHAFSDVYISAMAHELYDHGADVLSIATDTSPISVLESRRHAQLGLIYKDTPLCRAVSTANLVTVIAVTDLLRRLDQEAEAKFSIFYGAAVLASALHLSEIVYHLIQETEDQCRSLFLTDEGQLRLTTWKCHIFRSATLVDVEIFRFGLHGSLQDMAMRDTFAVLEANGALPETVSPVVTGTQRSAPSIFVAIRYGSQRVCSFLVLHCRHSLQVDFVDPSTSLTPVCFAILKGWTSFFDALVEQNATLDYQGVYPERHYLARSKSTYLHFCAEMKASTHFAEAIISKGVRINVIDAQGVTALFLAICSGAIDIAALLIRHGEDLNRPLQGGYTLLGQLFLFKHRTAVHNLEKAISNLVQLAHEFGVSLNPIVHDEQGLTVFHMVAGLLIEEDQSQLAVQLLVAEFGIDLINRTSKRGAYPIHEAITTFNIPAIEILLQSNVDLEVKDPYGNDLLEITRVLNLIMKHNDHGKLRSSKRFAQRTEHMLEILEKARDWPQQLEFFKLLRTLNYQLEPLVEKSTLINHNDPRREQIYRMVAKICQDGTRLTSDWLEVFEFERHVNKAINPTFTLQLKCLFEVDGHLLLSEYDMQEVYRRHPWMVGRVSERQLSGIQQAAAQLYYFNSIRNKLRTAQERKKPAQLSKEESLFAKLAECRSAGNFPYPQIMVKYPNRLSHDWTYALGTAKESSPFPQSFFTELENWNEINEKGLLTPVKFSQEFRNYHFKPPIQKVKLRKAKRIIPVFKWALYCSCVDEPFEPFSDERIAELDSRRKAGKGPDEETNRGPLREGDRCFHKTHYFTVAMPPPTKRPGFDINGNPAQPFLCGFEDIGS